MGGLTQGSGFRTFTEKVDSLNIKRPVSIKRPGLIYFEKSLLNVPYNLRKYFLKPLTSGTYNRNFRVDMLKNMYSFLDSIPMQCSREAHKL